MSITPEDGIGRYTGDELERLPASGCRYELVRGELIRLPFHGALHGLVAARLRAHLFALRVDGLSTVFAARTGF